MMIRFVAVAALTIAAGTAAAQTKPKPATALTITNARTVPATEVAVGAGEETVRVSKPLAPKAKTTLKLPKMSGCMVTVSATFADESVVDLDEVDVCKERTVRFTD
jgi:hypothetical protein